MFFIFVLSLHFPDEESEAQRSDGVQDSSPQNMSLWHIGHFELKLLKKYPVPEGYSDLPLSSESRK